MLRSCLMLAIVLTLGARADAQFGRIDDVFASDDGSAFYVQGNLIGAWQHLDSSAGDPDTEILISSSDFDPAVGTGAALGCSHDLDPFRVRVEIEGNWLGHSNYRLTGFDGANFSTHKAGVTQWSTMSNVWLDAPISDFLRGYAGGGIGVVGTDLVVNQVGDSSINLAWQVGGGLTIPFTDDCDFDVGYRYLDCGSTSVAFGDGRFEADLVSHQLMLSLRYYFR